MNWINKVIPNFNGQKFCILSSKPTDTPGISVYLLSNMEKEADYSLWTIEPTDDEEIHNFRPYEGADYKDVLEQLMDDFLENAFTRDG